MKFLILMKIQQLKFQSLFVMQANILIQYILNIALTNLANATNYCWDLLYTTIDIQLMRSSKSNVKLVSLV